MANKKKIILIIGFLLGVLSASSQLSRYNNQFEFKSHYGFTMPHHSYMNYLIEKNVFIAEIDYSIKTDGATQWSHIWRFPEWGAGFLMGETGNLKTLGFTNSLFGFIGVPIIETPRLNFKYRIGAGLAYLTESYDVRNNYYNVIIGSHFNAHIHFSLLLDYKPFDFPLYISAGFAYNHFSNGAIKKPNIGINQFTANLGIKYFYSDYIYSLPKRTIPYMYNKEWEFSGYYSAAVKQNDMHDDRYFFYNTLSFDAAIRINKQRSFGAGLSFIFDNSLRSVEDTAYKNFTDMLRLEFHLLQEVYFTEKFSVPMMIGTYLYNPYKPENTKFIFCVKAGLRYKITNYMYVNLMLKTHLTVADCIELGIGVKFNN